MGDRNVESIWVRMRLSAHPVILQVHSDTYYKGSSKEFELPLDTCVSESMCVGVDKEDNPNWLRKYLF